MKLSPALAAAAGCLLSFTLGGCGASDAYAPTSEPTPTPTPSASPSPLPQMGVTVAVAPEAQTVNAGSTVAYVVTVNPTNGLTGRVFLAATGLPAGVTSSFGESASVTFAPNETGPKTVTLALGMPDPLGADRPTVTFDVVATPEGAPEKAARTSARVTLNSTGSVGGVIQ